MEDKHLSDFWLANTVKRKRNIFHNALFEDFLFSLSLSLLSFFPFLCIVCTAPLQSALWDLFYNFIILTFSFQIVTSLSYFFSFLLLCALCLFLMSRSCHIIFQCYIASQDLIKFSIQGIYLLHTRQNCN